MNHSLKNLVFSFYQISRAKCVIKQISLPPLTHHHQTTNNSSVAVFFYTVFTLQLLNQCFLTKTAKSHNKVKPKNDIPVFALHPFIQ